MSCPKWPRCKGTYEIGKCHESQVLTRVGRGEMQSRPLVSWWPRINLPIGLTLKLLETNMQSIGNTTNDFLGNYPWRPSYTNFLRKPKVGYPWISHIHKMPSISNFQLQLNFSTPRRPRAQPWCFTDLRVTICCQLKNSLFQARQRSQAVNLHIHATLALHQFTTDSSLNHCDSQWFKLESVVNPISRVLKSHDSHESEAFQSSCHCNEIWPQLWRPPKSLN